MELDQLIKEALLEDMPQGDITTDNLDLKDRTGWARLVAKQDLVLSGREAFEKTYLAVDRQIKLQWHFNDGDSILKGQTVVVLKGPLSALLKGERTALNFLGHLSGIATLTHEFYKQTEGTKTRILDTRKTLPGWRKLEKKAVSDGGGMNHRMSLSDGILVKENHIRAAGSITKAVSSIRTKSRLPIEVECSTIEEIKECVDLKIHRILLDNMSNDLISEALKVIPNEIATEASGNMTLQRISSVARLGVTYISVGALTHSAPCADLSLQFDWTKES